MVNLVEDETWSINLEHGEKWWYAHVLELPGCFMRGDSRERVLSGLPSAIADHIAFLQANGINVADKATNFKVVEEIGDIPELGESGGAVAFFASDLKPVDEREFQSFLELMRLNRNELTTLVASLTEEDLEVRPLIGKRTIREDLRHIGNAEEWYISRMGVKSQRLYESYYRGICPKGRRPKGMERLEAVRKGTVYALEALHRAGISRTFKRTAYTRHRDELWTFRKVLRRFIEHEREHIGTIRKVVDSLAVREGL